MPTSSRYRKRPCCEGGRRASKQQEQCLVLTEICGCRRRRYSRKLIVGSNVEEPEKTTNLASVIASLAGVALSGSTPLSREAIATICDQEKICDRK